MLKEIEQVKKNALLLYSEAEVEAAIDSMAEQMNTAMVGQCPIVLCVMNGGIVITGKLITKLTFPLTLDAINASRYGNQISGSHINWRQKPASSLKDKVVLIIDDILDQGLTLDAIYKFCQEQGASYIYSAVLVDKKLKIPKPVQADFIGLSVEDHYIYGYGMDYKGYLRNAPGIYACSRGL